MAKKEMVVSDGDNTTTATFPLPAGWYSLEKLQGYKRVTTGGTTNNVKIKYEELQFHSKAAMLAWMNANL